MIGTETISRVIGQDVYDASGEKIGSASEVYLDDESGQPEWVTVKTGLFGTKESFVPIRDADLTDNGVRVPVSKDQVKDAPKVDTDGHLSPQEEQELYRHYGLNVGAGTTDTTVARRPPPACRPAPRPPPAWPAPATPTPTRGARSATTPPARPRTTP
jgi:sporulation protein YlmC with PRC-barrel domain